MSIEEILGNITQRLREEAFPNEQSISQGIVLPVLQELRWPVFETNFVHPEYATVEGRVDFALCDPPQRAKVFIEVKKLGRAEDGVRQALSYAFQAGVPFVVLTDGKTWSFYLPAEEGSYEERRVFKLDLFERSPNEAAEVLQRYLLRGRVVSGEALTYARKEYQNQNRRAIARRAIPDAWNDIIKERDDLLVDLLAEATESKAGIRPADNDVMDFLASLQKTVPGDTTQPGNQGTPERPLAPQSKPTDLQPSRKAARSQRRMPRRQGKVIIKGREFEYRNFKEAMVQILRELQRRDPNFLPRLSRHPKCQGRKHRFIAQSPEDLYPNSPKYKNMNEALSSGWFVATKNNSQRKMEFIKIASEVAGLKFGRDIVID